MLCNIAKYFQPITLTVSSFSKRYQIDNEDKIVEYPGDFILM